MDETPRDLLQNLNRVNSVNYKTKNHEKVTELELQILADILNSDHSSDGFDAFKHDENNMAVRGALSSLVKKGIIGIDNDGLYKEFNLVLRYTLPKENQIRD